MAAGGRDFERALGAFLALDVGEVESDASCLEDFRLRPPLGGVQDRQDEIQAFFQAIARESAQSRDCFEPTAIGQRGHKTPNRLRVRGRRISGHSQALDGFDIAAVHCTMRLSRNERYKFSELVSIHGISFKLLTPLEARLCIEARLCMRSGRPRPSCPETDLGRQHPVRRFARAKATGPGPARNARGGLFGIAVTNWLLVL
jgi:hypothetical protein